MVSGLSPCGCWPPVRAFRPEDLPPTTRGAFLIAEGFLHTGTWRASVRNRRYERLE